ncbi:MAG: phage integrase SAM-like domain and Arm DNA-binding domain-containing protein, partial [Bacteroidota bacterium]|nr:phage integrase SAM-like domain and Arm DNA-binding domain-containing protein [Bacteroidota bacterium]
MQNSINLLFYLKKPKAYTSGMVPIYLRITVCGQRAEISTGREWLPEKWNSSAGRANGTKEDVKALNIYLDSIQAKVYEAHRRLLDTGETVSAEAVKNRFTGKAEKPRMLVPIFQDHNNKMKALLGQEYSPGTLCRYTTALKHTTDFLNWKYSISDIDIRKIGHAFITEFEFYLRSVRKCNNNSAVKYVKNFGKIIRICISNSWLDKDPFVNYNSKFKEVIRAFLSQDEIDKIAAKEFSIERLDQ